MTVPVDLGAVRQHLETTVMVDRVRISRPTGIAVLDPETGLVGPVPVVLVWEGPGAVLSAHGLTTVEQLVGGKWLDGSASWYGLVTPLSASLPQRGDLVSVVSAASATAGTVGRTWQVLDPAEASTVEVARVTRLDEITGP
ncbi:hypothetical protein E6W39_29180 [Kitasatospora acidiphila]|uniref:Uncharacterized protein n=1 Tax=Kitasatospora acidiphila TaxID=2567942 RepID=A0A540W994_9ACTN|nr:DUF6093 family protein [Kitasatospora acidiphila]TQF05558.1 hypothetical protein E6W39_29180 [Kitasatospora acidiphila]